MPLPSPKGKEKEKDFIGRCAGDPNMVKEFPDNDQRVAVCHSRWRKAKGIKEPKKQEEEMKSELFRGDIVRGIENGKSGVDRENEIIHGFSVITKGEVKGHGVEADDKTVDQVVELGNAVEMGIKSRFGHPTMSSTALGTFLGRAKNFRRDGDIARADLHISETAHKTPNGDLAGYVMDLAEADPAAFGSSIVFKLKEEKRIEKDGTPMKDEETGEELIPLARVERLDGADIVDNPAANVGMFGDQFFSDGVKPSAEMTKFLDKFLLNPDAVEKTVDFLKRYSIVKQEEDKLANPDEGGTWAYCVCDKCNYSEEHKAGKPCGKCPKCGEQMHGAKEKPKEKAEDLPIDMDSWTIEDTLAAFENGAIDRETALEQINKIKEGSKENKEEVKKMGEVKKEEVKVVEEKVEGIKTEDAKDVRIAKLEKENIDSRLERKKESIASFLNEQLRAGKVLPAFKDKLGALFVSLSDGQSVTCLEAGAEVKLSQTEALKSIITSLIPMVKFGEEGLGGGHEETEEEKLDKRVKEIQEASAKLGKEVSYTDALIQAAKEAEEKK